MSDPYFTKKVGAQPSYINPITSSQRPVGGGNSLDWGGAGKWVIENGQKVWKAATDAFSAGAGFIGEHGVDIGLGALAAQQAYAAGEASKRSQGHTQKALDTANTNWAAGEDLRFAGKAGLLNRTQHDLGGVYGDKQNPFAAQRRPVAQAPVVDPLMPKLETSRPASTYTGGVMRNLRRPVTA